MRVWSLSRWTQPQYTISTQPFTPAILLINCHKTEFGQDITCCWDWGQCDLVWAHVTLSKSICSEWKFDYWLRLDIWQTFVAVKDPVCALGWNRTFRTCNPSLTPVRVDHKLHFLLSWAHIDVSDKLGAMLILEFLVVVTQTSPIHTLV